MTDRIAPPPPGIYPGVSYDEYASWDAVRASTLNEETAELMREAEVNPKDDTKDTLFGSGFHTLCLEPEKFAARCYVVPEDAPNKPSSRQLNAAKPSQNTLDAIAWWDDFTAKNAGKIEVTADQYEMAIAMIQAVWKHQTAGAIMRNASLRELSFVWRDEETGVLCKGRTDAIGQHRGETYITDVKTTRSAKFFLFRSQSADMGWHRSMAFYRHGLSVLSPHPRKCCLLAVTKTKRCPRVVPYELTDDALDIGMEQMRNKLRVYAEAKATGVWPSWNDPLTALGLPAWEGADEMEEIAA